MEPYNLIPKKNSRQWKLLRRQKRLKEKKKNKHKDIKIPSLTKEKDYK